MDLGPAGKAKVGDTAIGTDEELTFGEELLDKTPNSAAAPRPPMS